ncbi:MAG: hypothetical protein WA183_12160 [Chthoniobacterales bacterium]
MRDNTGTAPAGSAAAYCVLLDDGSARIQWVVEFLNQTEIGEFYEISSSNCYSGGIYWHSHGDSAGEQLLPRQMLSQRML